MTTPQALHPHSVDSFSLHHTNSVQSWYATLGPFSTMTTPQTLQITEIFHSIQGESTRVGLPCVFVRLTGCPLRCTWCDTEYAFHGGETMAMEAILDRVGSYDSPLVEVTGGEPLHQPGALILLTKLCDAGYHVMLETSGACDISAIDDRVSQRHGGSYDVDQPRAPLAKG